MSSDSSDPVFGDKTKYKIHSQPKRGLVNYRSLFEFANKPARVSVVRYKLGIYLASFPLIT